MRCDKIEKRIRMIVNVMVIFGPSESCTYLIGRRCVGKKMETKGLLKGFGVARTQRN